MKRSGKSSDLGVIILCGGQGTRLREETEFKPKPMVAIGGRPILWHIMQHYSFYGLNEFIICLGYKGDYIKRYMMDYAKLTSDLTVKLRSGDVMRHGNGLRCDWTVDLVDTGLKTATAGRLKRVQNLIGNSPFMLTYGDGVSDVNVAELVRFHREHGKIGTVTAVATPGRFGELGLEGGAQVHRFAEKPSGGSIVSGGFFVFKRSFFDYLPDDPDCVMEKAPMEQLSADGQLMAYRHPGFWHAMDTYREFVFLNDLWNKGAAPWKTWK